MTSGIRQIQRELQALQTQKLDGISVLFSDHDIMSLRAIIEGPESSPYRGGEFTVSLTFDVNYPQVAPKGRFITKIFHPNVSASGEICVNTLQKDWKAEFGIIHILLTIKCLLLVPNAESALNEEAGRLLLEDYESFAKKARLVTEIHAYPAAAEQHPIGNLDSKSGLSPASSTDAGKSLAERKKNLRKL